MRLNDNRITKVRIQNYRSLQDVTVKLGYLNVLVGANGSGKSNFVDALRFVGDALLLGLLGAVFKRSGAAYIQHRAQGKSSDRVSIGLELNINTVKSSYNFTLRVDQNMFHVIHEQCIIGDQVIFERVEDHWQVAPAGLKPAIDQRVLALPLLGGTPEVASVYDFLANMSFHSIYPNLLRQLRSQKPINAYPLQESGENFPSALHQFLDTSQWADDFKDSLRLVLPQITDIVASRSSTASKVFLDVLLEHRDGNWFEMPEESDGTLRILVLLLAMYQDPPRSLVALEEPELTIHPGILEILADDIKEASYRSQVIVTTHSPDLIHSFDVNDLRVVEMTNTGTQIGLIDDVQRGAIEDQLFKASDLLRIDGELRRATSEN